MKARAEAFGIEASEVDGQDILAVHGAMSEIVARSRETKRPAFLLCHTYRYLGHHVGDIKRPYRSAEEEEMWKTERDPIKNFGQQLVEAGMATQEIIDQIAAEVQQEADEAVEYAKGLPFPAASEVMTDVYA